MEIFFGIFCALLALIGLVLLVAVIISPFIVATKYCLSKMKKWMSLVIALALVYTTGVIGLGIYFVIYFFLKEENVGVENNATETETHD